MGWLLQPIQAQCCTLARLGRWSPSQRQQTSAPANEVHGPAALLCQDALVLRLDVHVHKAATAPGRVRSSRVAVQPSGWRGRWRVAGLLCACCPLLQFRSLQNECAQPDCCPQRCCPRLPPAVHPFTTPPGALTCYTPGRARTPPQSRWGRNRTGPSCTARPPRRPGGPAGWGGLGSDSPSSWTPPAY